MPAHAGTPWPGYVQVSSVTLFVSSAIRNGEASLQSQNFFKFQKQASIHCVVEMRKVKGLP